VRLPAVAIAAAFACGIVLGLHLSVVRNASSVLLLSAGFAAGLAFIFTGIVLVRFGCLFPAAVISLFSWTVLGFLGACIAEQPLPGNHVTSLDRPLAVKDLRSDSLRSKHFPAGLWQFWKTFA
jgi:hypothetical protein